MISRFAFVCGLVVASRALADVSLPSIFSDHMVLQRGIAIPIWGKADPGERVTVRIADRSASAEADARGRWSMKLDALGGKGPHELVVSASNTLTIADVLVGEVWFASGQSNMAMKVASARNFADEASRAKLPEIRMFTTARRPAAEPMDGCEGSWQVCSPDTVKSFSATAYFFGRKLHTTLGVPIGLINSSVGGTAVEAWTSLPAQRAVGEIAPVLGVWKETVASYDPRVAREKYEKQLLGWEKRKARAKAAGKKAPRRPRPPTDPRLSTNHPAALYNGMVHPHVPYAIRGAIWYQGERNRRFRPDLYGLQLATMIKDWRKRWGQGDFPFIWAQLPNFTPLQTEPVQEDGWVLVQEGMLKTLAVANTGMGVNIDVGEAKDIHPKNKQAVGKRLALWALGTTYGKDLTYSGPLYRSHAVASGKVVVQFEHTGAGLKSRGDVLQGFAIAGKDKKFVWADARIVGNTVEVSSPEVNKPASVRYSWAPNPIGNLFNQDGLPASPFRTDGWVAPAPGN